MEAVIRHEYELDGLCCPNCSKKIENRVQRLAGLSKVTMNYAFKKLTFFAGGEKSCDELYREINGLIGNIEEGIVVKPLCHSGARRAAPQGGGAQAGAAGGGQTAGSHAADSAGEYAAGSAGAQAGAIAGTEAGLHGDCAQALAGAGAAQREYGHTHAHECAHEHGEHEGEVAHGRAGEHAQAHGHAHDHHADAHAHGRGAGANPALAPGLEAELEPRPAPELGLERGAEAGRADGQAPRRAVRGFALPQAIRSRARLLKLAAGAACLLAATLAGELAAAPLPLAPMLALYIASYLLIGEEVLRSAFKNIKNGYIFDENFLMVVATAGAFAVGQYPEAVAVMIFYRVGEYFQDRAVDKSRASISQLLDIKPAFANLVTDGGLRQVPPEDVEVGQSVAVRPGERVPLDGEVLDGESYLDMKELTGESVPVRVERGSAVLSGSINTSGLLTVRADKAYSDSTVSKILYMVEDAAAKKAPVEKFITKFASVYTPAVMAVAALISVIPPIAIAAAGGGAPSFQPWIYRGLIFLVVSCPCALVLSVPLSYFSGIGAASARGILVKGGNYLDALSKVETVVFDKTGTLTKGVFSVTAITPAAGARAAASGDAGAGNAAPGSAAGDAADGAAGRAADSAAGCASAGNAPSCAAAGDAASGDAAGAGIGAGELLRLAAHAEMFSTHPIAKSVVAEYGKRAGGGRLDESAVKQCEEVAGHGVRASVGGRRVAVGNARLMELEGIGAGALPEAADTVLFVSVDGAYSGCIAVEDEIKSDAYGIEGLLRGAGVKNVLMLTGDNGKTAQAVGAKIGIGKVFSGLLPHQKVEVIEELDGGKAAGAKIAFAGDGINDAPVLARADVGFAMGGVGSDAAIEAADVVIMNDEPSKIAEAIRISHGTKRVVVQNIVFAVGVKAIVLALAAAGLANMWVAVFADVGVAVLAVLNSVRIGRMARV
ncbi:MAG: HAD-IC family P-type ATPase [Clostridiales bacterium]|nr:HAD-IC family P-type ATPase [Clostridiales bacterium]